jgi:drug/metabolite transporter (DMT)-like permease
LLVWDTLEFKASYLLGDTLAVIAAVFYAGYLLCVKRLQRSFSTAAIMAWSGLFLAGGRGVAGAAASNAGEELGGVGDVGAAEPRGAGKR